MRYFYLVIISLFISFGLVGCHSKDTHQLPADIIYNPNTAEGTSTMDMLPVITFDTEEHDFGQIIEGEVVTYAFKFKNTGKSDLLISSVSTSCGCTVSKYDREPVKPGEPGILQVTFDSKGRKGFQNKTITVLSNTQPNSHILHIKAKVIIPEQ